jgi:hypothetical protein
MVHHTQNYGVFGLFPSSGILGATKHDVSETIYIPPPHKFECLDQSL